MNIKRYITKFALQMSHIIKRFVPMHWCYCPANWQGETLFWDIKFCFWPHKSLSNLLKWVCHCPHPPIYNIHIYHVKIWYERFHNMSTHLRPCSFLKMTGEFTKHYNIEKIWFHLESLLLSRLSILLPSSVCIFFISSNDIFLWIIHYHAQI